MTTEFAYFAPGRTANRCNPAHTAARRAAARPRSPTTWCRRRSETQTAASITRPASFCGVVGYKPSFGAFDLRGIRPFADSFDTLGLLARSLEDNGYLRCALRDESFDPRSEVNDPHARCPQGGAVRCSGRPLALTCRARALGCAERRGGMTRTTTADR
ncbi:MAG TPA: amidase family protein [Casimicrobiaceae bacterium]|nr:amidase family protein [Casimicrobiaceae bacterium]